MSTKFPSISLRDGLQLWKKHQDISLPADQEHISEIYMYQLATPKGFQQADASLLGHLSHCPLCLERWFDACIEQEHLEELGKKDASDDWYSGGMLEAAATKEISSTLQLKSSCGHFQLSLYPDENQPGQGMITLEYLGTSKKNPEGKEVVIKDRSGHILMEGVLRGGRVARISEHFEKLDLQVWSIQIRDSKLVQKDS